MNASRLLFSFVLLTIVLAAQRPANAILKEFDGLHFPSMSDGSSAEAAAKFTNEIQRVAKAKGRLARELYEAHPEHARVGEVMGDRWTLMINSLEAPKAVLREVDRELAREGVRDDVRRHALLARARALISSDAPANACLDATTAFLDVDPKDSAAGFLILEVLRTRDVPNAIAQSLVGQVLKLWPDDRWVNPAARGYEKQLQKVGEPLGLAFDDLLSGDAVNTADGTSAFTLCVYWSGEVPADAAAITRVGSARDDLRVVGVVNFRMQGGADEAKDALRKANVAWPHCYDADKIANPWKSEYRTPRTPFFYLLDRQGNVVRFAYRWSVMAKILAGQSR